MLASAVFVTVADGQLEIVGSCLSVTITSVIHVAVLLLASVAVHVIVFVPTGNTAPDNVAVFVLLFFSVTEQLSI